MERPSMDVIQLKPERKAQLEDYAQRHGQDPATALDEALALTWNGSVRTSRIASKASAVATLI